MPRSTVEVLICFERTYCFHLQVPKESQSSIQEEAEASRTYIEWNKIQMDNLPELYKEALDYYKI
jgi:hypothetical protein